MFYLVLCNDFTDFNLVIKQSSVILLKTFSGVIYFGVDEAVDETVASSRHYSCTAWYSIFVYVVWVAVIIVCFYAFCLSLELHINSEATYIIC